MKKIFVIVPALAVLFSCAKIAELSQDETQASALSVVTTFEATPDAGVIADDEGKATINPTDGVVSWEAGDAILVSNGSTQAVYTYDENDGLFHNETGLANTGNFRAWYPASAVTLTEAGAEVTLPDTQVYDASAVRSAPMSASSTTTQLNFKNLCAILRFKITGGHTLSSLVFTSSVKGVAGAAVIADNALTLSDNDTKTLTLTTVGATLGTETPFYVVLPAQLYTGGFSLQINCADGWKFEKATTKDLPLRAGVIDGMKAFDAKLFSGGGGTDDNPFQIATEQDLLDLATYVNGSDHDYFADKSYLQTESITLTTANFTPIGNNADHSFYGHFDGNAKTIYNLTIDASSSDNRGLFGCMSAGTIEDVHINATGNGYSVISGKANVGAIVGRLAGGTIKDCGFGRTQVTGTGNNCGIVAGYVPGPNVLLQNNSVGATCSVTGNTQIGGIAGRINRDCVIEACEVKSCSVTGVSRVGGVLGYFISLRLPGAYYDMELRDLMPGNRQKGRHEASRKPTRRTMILDGRRFSTLEEFYAEASRLFGSPEGEPLGNLDALNDALRGGLGAHDVYEPLTIRWKHSEKSREDLGEETFRRIVEVIRAEDTGHDCRLILE